MRITSMEASKIMMRKLLSRVPHLAWELFNIHLSVSASQLSHHSSGVVRGTG